MLRGWGFLIWVLFQEFELRGLFICLGGVFSRICVWGLFLVGGLFLKIWFEWAIFCLWGFFEYLGISLFFGWGALSRILVEGAFQDILVEGAFYGHGAFSRIWVKGTIFYLSKKLKRFNFWHFFFDLGPKSLIFRYLSEKLMLTKKFLFLFLSNQN